MRGRTPASSLRFRTLRLHFADGRVDACFVIDVSFGGVAVSAELQPPVGTPLAIGSCVGRVVRVFRTGFAVKFVGKPDIDDLSRLIVRHDQDSGSPTSVAAAS